MAALGPYVHFGGASEGLKLRGEGHRAFGRDTVVGAMGEKGWHGLRALQRHHAFGSIAQDAVGLVLFEEVGGVDHHREIRARDGDVRWRISRAGGEVTAGGEAEDTDLSRVGVPFLGTGAHDLERGAGIDERHYPWALRVAPRDAVTQDDRSAAISIKAFRDFVAFVSVREAAVTAPGADQDDRRVRTRGWPRR